MASAQGIGSTLKIENVGAVRINNESDAIRVRLQERAVRPVRALLDAHPMGIRFVADDASLLEENGKAVDRATVSQRGSRPVVFESAQQKRRRRSHMWTEGG